MIGENRLVHYVYSAEHSFSDRVEGQEATRNGILIWDALALKGSCHIWIDGEGGNNKESEATRFIMWSGALAPEDAEGSVYYLLDDCPDIDPKAHAGQLWTLSNGAWRQWSGEISA